MADPAILESYPCDSHKELVDAGVTDDGTRRYCGTGFAGTLLEVSTLEAYRYGFVICLSSYPSSFVSLRSSLLPLLTQIASVSSFPHDGLYRVLAQLVLLLQWNETTTYKNDVYFFPVKRSPPLAERTEGLQGMQVDTIMPQKIISFPLQRVTPISA